jgi:hypothetical protein
MKKTLFIDFENTVISPVKGAKLSAENLAFKPGVFLFLGRIAREMNYEFFLINADKVSEKVMDFVVRIFGNEGIRFSSALLPEKNESGFDFKNACVITNPALADEAELQGDSAGRKQEEQTKTKRQISLGSFKLGRDI